MTTVELTGLIRSALLLKNLDRCRQKRPALSGRRAALLFEEADRESRWCIEAALTSHGASVHYFGPGETGLGEGEAVASTSQRVGNFFDLLIVNGLPQDTVEELARLSEVPVLCVTSPSLQPLAIMSDLATITEDAERRLSECAVTLLGDGATPAAQSLMMAAARFGIDLRICCPEEGTPDPTMMETCAALASETGGSVRTFRKVKEALPGSDYLFVQPWPWMGNEGWQERLEAMLEYRATMSLVDLSGSQPCRVLSRSPLTDLEPSVLSEALSERFGIEGVEMSRAVHSSALHLGTQQLENLRYCCEAIAIGLLS